MVWYVIVCYVMLCYVMVSHSMLYVICVVLCCVICVVLCCVICVVICVVSCRVVSCCVVLFTCKANCSSHSFMALLSLGCTVKKFSKSVLS